MTKIFGMVISIFCLVALPLLSEASMAATGGDDPYLWLEQVESPTSLEWVTQQNAATTGALESLADYAGLKTDVKKILFAKDNVPFSSFRQGYFYNFWQDAEFKHGLIRRATLAEYRREKPRWDVILDLDKLSKQETENWVYKNSTQLGETSPRYVLNLSRGGKDATVVREFDYQTREFIADGFNVPEANTTITPINENLVLLATSLDPADITNSGYPRSVKLWKRGQPLEQAETIYTAEKTDALVSAGLTRDGSNNYVTISRAIDFYQTEVFLRQRDGALRLLPIPKSAAFLDIHEGQVYAQLKDDLSLRDRLIPANTILRFALSDTSLEAAEVVFSAASRQTIEGVSVTKGGIYVQLLDNVRTQVLRLNLGNDGAWKSTRLPLPDTGALNFDPRSDRDASSFPLITYTDYLTPKTQYLVHDEDESFRLEKLKAAPGRFDASDFEVKQHFAKSADGTEVPYFVIQKKNLILDGANPTVLYGYGGFEVSMTPYYSGVIGKAWLERGGVYVVANIRGGGEFGPSWHQAALKHHRQRAYDDFIAVAEDLIHERITSPQHLGIQGGSNGGLLVGAVMVQRPELFGAVLCQVPLLDMVRYTQLLAGSLWIGEYGDPANSDDLAYLLTYSPYQNLRADQRYPTPLFTTSTKDDRVHPGHARKFAARMAEQGHPFYFYENINGGHAGSANLEESAHMTALEYTYLWSRLK